MQMELQNSMTEIPCLKGLIPLSLSAARGRRLRYWCQEHQWLQLSTSTLTDTASKPFCSLLPSQVLGVEEYWQPGMWVENMIYIQLCHLPLLERRTDCSREVHSKAEPPAQSWVQKCATTVIPNFYICMCICIHISIIMVSLHNYTIISLGTQLPPLILRSCLNKTPRDRTYSHSRKDCRKSKLFPFCFSTKI